MNWIDFCILAVVGISACFGAMSGLIWQIGKIGVLILSFLASVHLHGPVAKALGAIVKTPEIALALSYLITFVAAYAILITILWLVAFKGFKTVRLKGIDRCLGAGLGVVKGAILSSILLLVLTCYPVGTLRQDVHDSRLAPIFLNISRLLVVFTPDELQQKWEEFKRSIPMNVVRPWDQPQGEK